MQEDFWPRHLVIVCRWAIRAAGVMTLGYSFLITLDVLIRAAFRVSLLESFELSSYAFGISLALALPFSFIAGAHIRINLAERIGSPRFNAVLDMAALLSMLAFAALTAYFGFMTFLDSAQNNVRSNTTLAVPLAVPQGIWAFGLAAFTIVILYAVARGSPWLARPKRKTLLEAARVTDDQLDLPPEASL